MRPLAQGEHLSGSWLVPALAAAGWWAVIATAGAEPIATQRSLVFIGGPLLLLAGLHARLFAYLHASERLRLLPLPIGANRHWQAANRRHGPELAITVALGAAALLAANPGNWPLACDFLWLGLFAWLLEPGIAAAGAHFGRRFPADSRTHELQRSLGGGWTTPEAVVHLYAPALGLGLAALLAMPGQLGWARWIDGGSLTPAQVLLGVGPLPVALGLRLLAPRIYRACVWEAVPWLAEATRTVAGPAQPEPTPTWLRAIADPWARLIVTQFLRLTPLPALRLLLLLGAIAFVALRDASPTGPVVAASLAVCGAWLVPARALRGQRSARSRLAGALPLGPRQREGRAGWVVGLLWGPVLGLLGLLILRLQLG